MPVKAQMYMPNTQSFTLHKTSTQKFQVNILTFHYLRERERERERGGSYNHVHSLRKDWNKWVDGGGGHMACKPLTHTHMQCQPMHMLIVSLFPHHLTHSSHLSLS